MRNLRHLVFLTFLVLMATASAATITESRAREIASGFMARKALPSTRMHMASKAPRKGAASHTAQAAYYVFNSTATQQGGYVIVAGDDRLPAVLGYSDHGTFDEGQVPEAMQELLDSYAAQVEALSQGAQPATHFTAGSPIMPLLTCQWSQNSPYKVTLPFINGVHPPVGCVATAMAQVMYYWKWPTTSTAAIPAYTTYTKSIYMPELPISDFNWSILHDTYLMSDSLSTSALEAAKVSKYCAQALQMDFNKESSSADAFDISTALVNFFGYKSTVHTVSRRNHTTQEWESMIYNELAAKRPVVYRGAKNTGGHAFVCDGYDGNGMFHINWGWNGQSNGYFLLNVLNPDAQGTGSSSGAYGYIIGQLAILGIEPGTATSQLELTNRLTSITNYNPSRSNANSDFSISLTTEFINLMPKSISFDYGWGLYKGSTLVSVLYKGTQSNLKPNYYISPTRTMSFGSGISSGNFRIVPIYSSVAANNWQPCIGSDINYVEVNINGSTCTATCHGNAATPSYQVNDITVSGNMHPNRPVNITLNVTNKGNSMNDQIYMFANGTFYAKGFVNMEKGESGNVDFVYYRETAGTTTLTFSLNENGNSPIASRTVTINAMPYGNLTGNVKALNVTNEAQKIIHSNKFSVEINASNTTTTPYQEDITVKFYKRIYGNYGTMIDSKTQTVNVKARQPVTVQFETDNVMNGWQYFAIVYYYSEGQEVRLGSTSTYTIYIPDTPAHKRGDVNGDGEVNIADANAVINIIQGKSASIEVRQRADVNGDNEINIADINAIIKILLS